MPPQIGCGGMCRRTPQCVKALGISRTVTTQCRAHDFEEDVGVSLYANELFIGTASAAKGRNRNVRGGVHGLSSSCSIRLPANEVAKVSFRTLVRQICVARSSQLCLDVIWQEAVDDGDGLHEPSFITISTCAVANQQLPVDVEGFRIAVGENVVARKPGGVIKADESL